MGHWGAPPIYLRRVSWWPSQAGGPKFHCRPVKHILSGYFDFFFIFRDISACCTHLAVLTILRYGSNAIFEPITNKIAESCIDSLNKWNKEQELASDLRTEFCINTLRRWHPISHYGNHGGMSTRKPVISMWMRWKRSGKRLRFFGVDWMMLSKLCKTICCLCLPLFARESRGCFTYLQHEDNPLYVSDSDQKLPHYPKTESGHCSASNGSGTSNHLWTSTCGLSENTEALEDLLA